MWLFARRIVDLLAAPTYFEAHEAVGLVSTGVMLYALYFVLVVIIGRTGRTEFSLPATLAGTVVNIGLNLILVPPLGIVGAGVALVASYLVLLAVMYVFSQRLFPVPYEWRRILQVVAIAVLVTLPAELLLPKDGILAWVTRAAAWLCFPLLLWVTRFPDDSERAAIRGFMHPGALVRAAADGERRPERADGRGARGDRAGDPRRGPVLGPLADRRDRALRVAERAEGEQLALAEPQGPAGRRLGLDAAAASFVVESPDEHRHVTDRERFFDIGADDLPGLLEVGHVAAGPVVATVGASRAQVCKEGVPLDLGIGQADRPFEIPVRDRVQHLQGELGGRLGHPVRTDSPVCLRALYAAAASRIPSPLRGSSACRAWSQ